MARLSGGFTLIELITVMVVLSLIAAFSSGFVVQSMKSINSVSDKTELLNKARLSNDYMIRRLRNALPYSLRTTNDGDCLQFMPIASSGLYLNPLPSVVNGGVATGSIIPIDISPVTVNANDADYLVVAASSVDEIYGLLPGSIAEIDSTTSTSVTLLADKQWLRNSLTQRFYIVSEPAAFCLVGDELRLYENLSISDSLVLTSGSHQVLSHSASAFGTPFSISAAVEDRNIRVTLSLLFSDSNNRLESIKQVVVRNVP